MRQWFLHPGSVAAMVVAAIAVRLAVGAWFESRLPAGRQFEFGDSDGYRVLGKAIAAGEPYEYRSDHARVFRMPGYPLVLSPIFWWLGPNASPMWGRGLSAVLGGLTCGLMVWWGTLLFDFRAGVIAGWITAFYPGAIAMSSFILSEAPFMPLMVAHLALATAAFRATSVRRSWLLSVAAGIAAASAIYMRPSWLLFVPFSMVVGLMVSPNRRAILAQTCIAAIAICLCLLPWWVRNYRLTRAFVPTTLQVGISLYDGLNPWADGASDLSRAPKLTPVFVRNEHLNLFQFDSVRAIFKDGREQTYASRPREGFERCENRILTELALRWARENPVRVLELVGIKFQRMWNVIPNEPMFRSAIIKFGVAITFTPILILGGYGLRKFGPRGWPYLLAAVPALYFTLLHVIFVASIRYREPAMLGFIVLASGVVAGWIWGREPLGAKESVTEHGGVSAQVCG